MIFPLKYKILNQSLVETGSYKISPLRYQDRYKIMKWRNEQMYHLRQNELLTKSNQDKYFKEIVLKTFDQDNPDQILFSYLEQDNCIGYGGLVHINWTDKNAEISFIMETKLENDFFSFHWNCFLKMIQRVAFQDLQLHKVFIYAFDVRPHLYDAIKTSGFYKEAVLKEHCLFNEKFIDVVISSKINNYASKK